MEEVSNDDLEITKHPIQLGASVTDHAFKQPVTVTLNVMFSADDAPLHETYGKLLDLQAQRTPFGVVTGKRVLKNMLIKTLSQTTDAATETVLAIKLDLQEIIIVSLSIVGVPERSRQANPGVTGATERAGRKSPVQATEPRSRSALSTLFGGG